MALYMPTYISIAAPPAPGLAYLRAQGSRPACQLKRRVDLAKVALHDREVGGRGRISAKSPSSRALSIDFVSASAVLRSRRAELST
jgi:hypothetical protein